MLSVRTLINNINSMDYHKLYNNIINNAKSKNYDGYTETHHIIPRSVGGTDDKSNLVKLSAREHFLCHYILTKMYEPKTAPYYKMLNAFIMMMHCKTAEQQRYITSRKYAGLRQEYAKARSIKQTGSSNSQYGTHWITNMIVDKCLKAGETLPDGWVFGQKEKHINIAAKKAKKQQKKEAKAEYVKNKQHQLQEYYRLYSMHGFVEFVKLTNYKFTQPNLVSSFERNLSNFVSQNGKPRNMASHKSKIK